MKILACFLMVLSVSLACAQQSYFNVPSSEFTPKHELFVQEQLNFNKDIVSNLTLDYGLNDYLEAGLNVMNLDYSTEAKRLYKNYDLKNGAYSPLIMANFNVKLFKLERNYFAFGTQIGFNSFTKNKEPSAYFFLNYKAVAKNDKWNAVFGIYYGDQSYLGKQNSIGVQTGFEYKANKALHLMAEAIIGQDNSSNSVIGIVYYPLKKLPISLGYLHPILSNNKNALVLEITYAP